MTLDYGLIGNGRTAALVSLTGGIDWCCLPDFDSPSVFGRILDAEKGGTFAIEPAEPYTAEQAYIRNTTVLETVFRTEDAEFKVIDFMPRDCDRVDEADYAHIYLVRIIRVLKGRPEVSVRFDPRLDYGRSETRLSTCDKYRILAEDGTRRVYLQSSLPADHILEGRPARLEENAVFIVSWDRPAGNTADKTSRDWIAPAAEYLDTTVRWWQQWIKQCHLPAIFQDEIIRSALTLKLMIYEKTGATVAAVTASLPEEIGANRNWDYRYCWLRDSLFVVSVMFELSLFREKENYVEYIKKIANGGNGDFIRPLFTLKGDIVPRHEFLDHWRGYADSRPVRIGNDATEHYQHDVYGEIMLVLHQYFSDRRFVVTDRDAMWEAVRRQAELARKHFPTQDSGPWEFNDMPNHYTFSKVMCWVAMDRAADIAERLGKTAERAEWCRIRDEMHREIMEKAWNEKKQAITQSYESDELDATTLLLPVVGFISAKHPKMRATIDATERELMRNGYVYRYTHEDDFGKPRNAFLVCSFWMADAWILCGEFKKAREMFDRLLACGNHLDLFSEHVEPDTGRLVGNFPQGYTHVAIIYTALLLSFHESLEKGLGYFSPTY